MRYFVTGQLSLDREKCVGCGLCVDICPHAVFEIGDKKAEIVRLGNCMECGACAQNCPVDAIKAGKGVGCAAAVIYGILNQTEPSCDCGPKNPGGGCCG